MNCRMCQGRCIRKGGGNSTQQYACAACGTCATEYYFADMKGELVGGLALSASRPQRRTSSGLGPALAQTRREFGLVASGGSPCVGLDLLTPPSVYSTPTEFMSAADRRYELADHLGNVAAVVTGQLIPGNGATPYQPVLVSGQGYEPFGSLLPGRNYSSDAYRFGFGGMPKDDEVHGSTGTSYDFGARLYDPRVGRWLSLDPMAAQAPGKSPYAYVSNNPISRVDKDGKIDFQYTVSYRCNADKTYTKVIKATAIYYVVNVSTSPYFDAGGIPSERSQDWKATITPKNVVHPDGTQITSVEFDLRFETRNLDPASYSKLPQNANVHFIVDEVENSAKHGDMAGAGTFEGQAIVSELGDVRRRTHVTHERGHNFGFLFERNPMDGDDPHHSADKSNVMSYGGGGEFPLAAMQQWLQTSGILGGQPEGTYSYGSGKAQADGIGLLKDKATKCDGTKYDKVTR